MGKTLGIRLFWGMAGAALLALGGCGRTSSDCEACGDSSPRAGTGGSSAGSGGSGIVAGAAGTVGMGGRRVVTCDVGAVNVPLVRYSLVDLERTLDRVLGPGSPFTREGSERKAEGAERLASLQFVEQLVSMGGERALSATLEPERLQVCEASAADRTSCVDSWIREIGQQLYGRPLTDAQVASYVLQFDSSVSSASPEAAARLVLRSMVLSPYFVFRIEQGESGTSTLEAPPGGAPPPSGLPVPTLPAGTLLDSFEIAARLSHFVTRSAPDAELLASAASGRLRSSEEILAQFERLASSDLGLSGRTLQHLEWLGIEDLTSSDVANDGALAQDMLEQSRLFIQDVLQNRQGSLLEMLTSSRQFLNRRLTVHYGILPPRESDSFGLLELDPALYAGVLGQGATLSRYSKLTQRGAHLIMDRLQCAPIPPPPPGIDFDALPYMGTTPRERISSVTENTAPCMACHDLVNPAGFALEAFDNQGRLTGFDTTGALPLLADAPIQVDGPADLGRAIAWNPNTRPCVAKRYLEYALDRPLSERDDPLLGCLANALADSVDLDLNYLARLVVTSSAGRRMTRDPSTIVATSAAADAIEHAVQETGQLLAAFPEPAEQQLLNQYIDSLRLWASPIEP